MTKICMLIAFYILISLNSFAQSEKLEKSVPNNKPRVIVTTDGEADDRASMVRFLLTCDEFQVEGIINTSSQFHWVGGEGWNAFHPVTWVRDYIGLYAQVYSNLKKHDPDYPSPEYLLSKWKVGNINGIGEDKIRSEGSDLIVKVLLDENPQPVWIQAWGGCNTIARALKTIQEDYPDKMKQVAAKLRLYLIWEQDDSYQKYIRPNWEKYNIPTIIADQFDCMAYIWPKVLPEDVKKYFESDFVTKNIIQGHGPLCAAYENNHGAFNAEGDTPSFLYNIPTGLRSMESPDYGGWGGRFVKVRNNVWMDPLPDSSYEYPKEKWGIENSWSKKMENDTTKEGIRTRTNYFKPLWRWLDAVQNDFAARAEWCVKDYASANHPPVVKLNKTPLNILAKAGSKVKLDASKTIDPDGDQLAFQWWNYDKAGSYKGNVIPESKTAKTIIRIPDDAKSGDTIHMICEVKDSGTPTFTRYKRVIITITK